MTSSERPAPSSRSRHPWKWLIAATVAIGVAAGIAILLVTPVWRTDVTIRLSYVGDDGQEYSCVYDYSTPDRLRMPGSVVEQMNARDWSGTGQLIFEWAKDHPAESWSTKDEFPADDPRSTKADETWRSAMDEYVQFPPWHIDAGNGPEYALRWEKRPGGNCEEGVR